MKKLFLIFGKNSREDMQLAYNLPSVRFGYQGFIIYTLNDDELTASLRIKTAIQVYGGNDYDNILVVYSGSNLDFFKKTTPYQKLDISDLKNKLTEVVSNANVKKQKEMLIKLFVGSITNLLTGSTIPTSEFGSDWTVIPFHIVYK